MQQQLWGGEKKVMKTQPNIVWVIGYIHCQNPTAAHAYEKCRGVKPISWDPDPPTLLDNWGSSTVIQINTKNLKNLHRFSS